MTALDTFVLISGTFSVLSVFPLMYLAVRSVHDARDLRRIQYELAGLVTEATELSEEVHELQREIQSDQRDAKTDGEHTRRTVEHVSETVEQVSSAVEHVNEAVTAGAAAPPRRQPLKRIAALLRGVSTGRRERRGSERRSG
jgi:uncharacterized protein YoxC